MEGKINYGLDLVRSILNQNYSQTPNEIQKNFDILNLSLPEPRIIAKEINGFIIFAQIYDRLKI